MNTCPAENPGDHTKISSCICELGRVNINDGLGIGDETVRSLNHKTIKLSTTTA
jgi:hypothetical protein